MIRVKFNKITRRWRVQLVGDNHEILSVSQRLKSKDAVRVNIAAQQAAILSGVEEWDSSR